MIKKIAFIGHPVRDLTRARAFYGDILGLKLTADYAGKWCEFDSPDGKSIALDAFSPEGTAPYLALETDDIEAEVARLRKHEVKVVLDVTDNKVCKMAIVEDSEGNKLMLHQMAPERLKG